MKHIIIIDLHDQPDALTTLIVHKLLSKKRYSKLVYNPISEVTHMLLTVSVFMQSPYSIIH